MSNSERAKNGEDEPRHSDYWDDLQRRGLVPSDVEYDEVSRGCVTFNPRSGIALLMLDPCILGRPESVKKIREAMHLTAVSATEVSGDSHYRCPGCRHRPKNKADDDL
jgi:hypothetical protein